MMSHDYSNIFAKLAGLRKTSWGWQATCPAHDDQRQSLSLKIGTASGLLAKCHAGCTFTEIAVAIGVPSQAWFPDYGERMDKPVRAITKVYDYLDMAGNVAYQVVRFDPKDFRQRRPDDKGGWTWNLEGVHRIPYRLPELMKRKEQPVLIVEGEKDADALHALGFVATTNAGGAGKWTQSLSVYLRDRRVVVLPDNDEPGLAHAIQVAGSLVWAGAASVRIVQLPELAPKGDVSDWLNDVCAKADTFHKSYPRDELTRIIKQAAEWKPSPPPAREAA